ncbi:MAG: hypothetical protein WA777_03410 [Rhodanobacter sp.]
MVKPLVKIRSTQHGLQATEVGDAGRGDTPITGLVTLGPYCRVRERGLQRDEEFLCTRKREFGLQLNGESGISGLHTFVREYAEAHTAWVGLGEVVAIQVAGARARFEINRQHIQGQQPILVIMITRRLGPAKMKSTSGLFRIFIPNRYGSERR